MPGRDAVGDHPEGSCPTLAGARTQVHNDLARGLMEYLRECQFQNVRLEVTEWDSGDLDVDPLARRARATPTNGLPRRRTTTPDRTKRVPDVLATSPDGLTEYVIDCRIAWNLTTSGVDYESAGDLAEAGALAKWRSWRVALARHQAFADRPNVCFVPFSLECFGAWGQEASAFFNMAASHVSNFRDVDHFHWSEASFRRYWATALSMTVARGQADVVCRHARNNPSFTTRGFALGDTPLGGPG